jgi:small GTP-binding protein
MDGRVTVERGLRLEVLASDAPVKRVRIQNPKTANNRRPAAAPATMKIVSSHPQHVAGFVSLLGRPNAGKSTLLNALVGTKVAIVADKPQTTRTTIQGVWTTEQAQVVFIDTPGIHQADTKFNQRMMQSIQEALDQRDLLLFLHDATRAPGPADEAALAMVKAARTPVLLVLTKIDRLARKQDLLPVLEWFRERHDFEDYLPVSAPEDEGIDDLRQVRPPAPPPRRRLLPRRLLHRPA